MKIGVISDTHLRSVPESFIEELKRVLGDVGTLVHCGDWVCPELFHVLEARGWQVLGVAGNMDPPEVRSLLPEKRVLELQGSKVGIVHGWGSPEGIEKRVVGAFQGVDLILFGHTHRPFSGGYGGVKLFNPGALCGWGNPQGPTLGIVEVGGAIEAKVVPLGRQGA